MKKVKIRVAKSNGVPSTPANTETATSVAVRTEPLKTNRISLQLVRPGAKRVFVAGSFNGWKPEATPLLPRGDGSWSGDLAIQPGRHEYLFVVDGQWLPDPNAQESVSNPFGGQNSVLIVSE